VVEVAPVQVSTDPCLIVGSFELFDNAAGKTSVFSVLSHADRQTAN
jgi:hypothetical protein